jgi:ABC-2 type transport system ATP-binding protein
MLELCSVTKRFYETTALSGVSLKLLPGRITLLLGPNGAGKTTLNLILAGILFPDEGEVFYNGGTITTSSGLTYSIGYVGDTAVFDPALRVEEFLFLIAGLKNIFAPETAVKKVLSDFSLVDVCQQRIGTLSLGFQQRVSLAQAFLGDPDILLLDEPGNGLDPQQFRELENLLLQKKNERIILVSTHRIKEAERLADHLVLLDRGRVICDGDRKEVLTRIVSEARQLVFEKPCPEFSRFLDSRGIPCQTEGFLSYRINDWQEKWRPEIFRFLAASSCTVQRFSRLDMSLEELFFRFYRETEK